MPELPPAAFKRWIHVHEEDTDDVRVYRAAGSPLPPARGRRGFELRPDGTFVRYAIGRGDRPEGSEGRWRAAGPGRARVELPGEEPLDLEIVSVDDDRLTLRR